MTHAGRYQLIVWAGDEPDVHPLPERPDLVVTARNSFLVQVFLSGD